MRPKGTFMNFFYNLICFVSIHASEQNRVIVPFVQHTPIEEKLSRVLAQGLLINDRSIIRVFFGLEIPFDVIEPRFFIRFTFHFKTERRLIQPHYSDRRGIIRPSDLKHGRQSSQSVCQIVLLPWDVIKGDLVEIRDQLQDMISVWNQIRVASLPISIDLTNYQSRISVYRQVFDSQINGCFNPKNTSFVLGHIIGAIKTDSSREWNMKTYRGSDTGANTIS